MNNEIFICHYENPKLFNPIKCLVKKRINCGKRDDYAIVEIMPSLDINFFNEKNEMNEFVIAPRHKGGSLFPINENPLHIYLCIINKDLINDNINPNNLKIIYWCLAFDSINKINNYLNEL